MMIDKTDKSLGELFTDLTRDMVDLVRQEIALARAEMSSKMADIQAALISVAVGAAILLAGLFILLLAVVRGVEMILPESVAPWLAPLIVGLAIIGIGYVLLKGGAAKLSADKLMPHKTMDSLKRDKLVAQEKL
ncbi:MAG TPA: phage holin family protein [Noviherbaspirillum sp.]|uniref:phage holin family protein n=1 Tax=Noviherbaspirillum sp. TaxID=1926288 RepID=UPI002D532ED4|nr:phage holin family protein [Noviherbaspirillum sp.]HYD94128.1 phage holin family protein [Noviherbaspirillum sp.]